MKKICKIGFLPIIAAFFILTMSFFTISGSAEEYEESALDIAYCNLSFENEVHLMYAVKSNDANVKLLVWEEAQSEYMLGTETAVLFPLSNQMEIDGDMYTVFKYTGLSAKQLADDVYVRAYISGSDEYGGVHKYSILQYAYNKLGKTGTASTNEKLIKMLNAMLEYGEAAQEYHDYKLDRLANADFVQITLNGGTLPDGFNKGLYPVGSTITITARKTESDGSEFVEWVDENGEFVADTAIAKITAGEGNMTYTALYNKVAYSEGLEYTLSADGTYYSVTGIGTCTDTDIVFPTEINSIPVKSIAESAFSGNTKITSIIIPKGITDIGFWTFTGCTNLKSVIIPERVTRIKGGNFSGCTSLESVSLPNGLNSIEEAAFYDCISLKTILIPETVTEIWDSAFYNCVSLKKIDLPNGLTRLDSSAFDSCTSLSYNEYENAYYLGNSNNLYLALTKAKDTSITSCKINDNTKFLFYGAFNYCRNLLSINIGNGITKITSGCFYNCTNLETITVNSGNVNYCSVENCLIEIESKTLVLGCKNSIIPTNGSVTSIGDSAFSKCTGLKNITIPNSIDYIADSAFSGCTNLAYNEYDNAYYLGNESNLYLFLIKAKNTSITSCNINSNTKIICGRAFYDCYNLTSITIPNSVMSIGVRAFFMCDNLTSVIFENQNGWFRTYSSTAISGTTVDVTNAITNATDLKNINHSYCWKRRE